MIKNIIIAILLDIIILLLAPFNGASVGAVYIFGAFFPVIFSALLETSEKAAQDAAR